MTEPPCHTPGCCPETPLVAPRRGKRAPRLAPLAVLAANTRDLLALAAALGGDPAGATELYTSRLLQPAGAGRAPVLAGPLIGAPYAVMLLETLAAWGVRQVLFLGWCGALAPELAAGDLLLPRSALIDEGTSRQYRPGARSARPDRVLTGALGAAVADCGASATSGAIWTTDGIFRETAAKVARYRLRGALAVEMELSALFTAGRHLGVAVAGLLVVSDLLSGPAWQPGFRDPRFHLGRQLAVRVIQRLCQRI